MYYYQHHIGDYRKDTTHLSILEHGAYRQLLDLYYISEQPLPLDDAKLMRLVCARNADEVQAVKNVLDDFFEKTKDGYIQSRCDKEINAYHGKSLKAKASADARWNKNKDLQDANALRTECEGNANHKPLTNNHKPAKYTPPMDTNSVQDVSKLEAQVSIGEVSLAKVSKVEDSFDDFWKAYPKKTGKDRALIAWKKKRPPLIEVLEAMQWQTISEQWTKDGGKYIPNPATYLNDGRWKDEPLTNARESDLNWFLGNQPAIEKDVTHG